MRASVIYPLLWIAWIAAFLAIELSALWSGHGNFSLSDYIWRLEQINRGWTFLRFFIAAFCAWLFCHMAFHWFT
jgi:hypothetical protein